MVAHPKIPKSESEVLRSLQQSQSDLARAIGRGQPALRDPAGNILALNPESGTPLLVAKDHDVGLNMSSTAGLGRGTLYVTNEDGSQPRDLVAFHYYGDVGDPSNGNTPPYADGPYNVWSDTHGVHYGDVHGGYAHFTGNVDINGRVNADRFYGELGDPGQGWHAYITSHGVHDGDSYGVHHGPTDPQVQGPVGPVGPPGPKGFVINHPKDDKRWLVHACTESPANGVEYWGSAILLGGEAEVCLPDYFEELTRRENRTVHLTAIVSSHRRPRQGRFIQTSTLSATYPTRGKFRIIADGSEVEAVWWLVKAIRFDIPDLLVEPLRTEVQVTGIGPYRTYVPVAESGEALSDSSRPTDIIHTLWTAMGIEQARSDGLAELNSRLRETVYELHRRIESLEQEIRDGT